MSGKKKGRSRSPARATGTASPGSTASTPSVLGTSLNPMQDFLDMLYKAKVKDDDDFKSIKLSQFSDGTEWDAVVFELELLRLNATASQESRSWLQGMTTQFHKSNVMKV